MFPDPITPKSYPDKLKDATYDPFHVMPVPLPPHPRVLTNGAQIRRARERIAGGNPVDVACLDGLIKNCRLDEKLPATIAIPDKDGLIDRFSHAAVRNALAFLLTDKEQHRGRAIALVRLVAHACPKIEWSGFESGRIYQLAAAYDCLAAGGLDAADDNLFRDMLWAMPARLDNCGHLWCNNHNSMNQTGRLAAGAALGHLPTIHDTLYGCGAAPKWRYGLIHTLRHDILSDGMQWEGSMSYHMVVAVMLAESLTILENCGVDLWHRDLPSLAQDDGFDEHRGWGPKGMKCVKAMFDVFFYQMFANGDYSNLHDQILGNIRGAWGWWPLFPKAFELYGDPKYAWLLRRMERSHQPAQPAAVPLWFRDGRGDMEFVRLECRDYPEGEFSFAKDASISLAGKHVNGCSMLPVNGSAVLRAEPDREDSPAAMLYWGPHWAGHRSPGCLHVDIHAGGRRVTHAPHLYDRGYDEPKHLTWVRTTIAHNTVTVDERSMFPFDFETESLWECDRWRDTISDSALESFQPEREFKAIRVSNDNVYTGVKLDRSLLLTRDYLIDVYRVTSAQPHQYDWAAHLCAELKRPARAKTVRLGDARGYRHFTGAWRHPQTKGWIGVPFKVGPMSARVQILLPSDAELIVAKDPEPDARTPIGDLEKPQRRTSLIVRARGPIALFLSVWSFGGKPVAADLIRGAADSDVEVALGKGRARQRWRFARAGKISLLNGRAG